MTGVQTCALPILHRLNPLRTDFVAARVARDVVREIALDTGRVTGPVEGIDTIDPSFGMRAKWVASSRRADALARMRVVH